MLNHSYAITQNSEAASRKKYLQQQNSMHGFALQSMLYLFTLLGNKCSSLGHSIQVVL